MQTEICKKWGFSRVVGIVKGCILRDEEKLLVADYGVSTGDKLFVVKPKEKPRKRKHNEISTSHRLVKVASGILTYESTDSSVDQVSSSFFPLIYLQRFANNFLKLLLLLELEKKM